MSAMATVAVRNKAICNTIENVLQLDEAGTRAHISTIVVVAFTHKASIHTHARAYILVDRIDTRVPGCSRASSVDLGVAPSHQ